MSHSSQCGTLFKYGIRGRSAPIPYSGGFGSSSVVRLGLYPLLLGSLPRWARWKPHWSSTLTLSEAETASDIRRWDSGGNGCPQHWAAWRGRWSQANLRKCVNGLALIQSIPCIIQSCSHPPMISRSNVWTNATNLRVKVQVQFSKWSIVTS